MHAGTVSLSASAGSKKATRVNTDRSGTAAHTFEVAVKDDDATAVDDDADADADADAGSADSLGCAVGASVDGTLALLDEK